MTHGFSAEETTSSRIRRIHTGISRVFGFAISVVTLGIVSLIAIPAMIAADGKDAWGAVALGQAVGTSGAVLASYGWGLFGPAAVVGASVTERRTVYLESVLMRTALFLPAACICAGLAYMLAPTVPVFAAAGAISASTISLTANWYFVGMARPYVLFIAETIPRTLGMATGIVMMSLGSSAIVLPIFAAIGMLAAFIISTIWILHSTAREGAERSRPQRLSTLFTVHRHGIATDLAMTVYYAAPLMIVSVVSPQIQPTFALIDRFGRQADVALTPVRTVLQAWVPRATEDARRQRVRIAVGIAAILSITVAAAMLFSAAPLMTWLGNGQISIRQDLALIVAIYIALNFFVRVFELVALAPFGNLNIAAKAIVASAFIGLPSATFGAVLYGAIGAVGGVVVGFIVCIIIEALGYIVQKRARRALIC